LSYFIIDTIWKSSFTLADANAFNQGTAVSHLGIEIIEIGDNFIKATMPVDARTKQPMGLLHGGASVLLAETLGSMAAYMSADPGSKCVGLEVNANHVRAVTQGHVIATATPFHIGRRTQVWNIVIQTPQSKDVSICRLTVAILND
jgi:1,4-dihydroxy-2-naphthoyl-CoA hydrolase